MKCNKRQQQIAANETIKPNKHQRVLETIMKNATQMWCSNPIHLRNPLQFLILSSHCINDTFMEASQVQFAMELSETHENSAHTTATAVAAAAAAAAAVHDDHHHDDYDERSFNSLKSGTTNRKIRTSTAKDFKKTSNMNAITSNQIAQCANVRQMNGNNHDSYNGSLNIESSTKTIISNSNSNVNEINFNKSEPPPLAFYPKNRRNILQTPILFSTTEPPPLVPIARFNFA